VNTRHFSAHRWGLPFLSSVLTCATLIVLMVLTGSQPAYSLPIKKGLAIPAFARKYALPCSACHTAWPELNSFGIAFRDNGYQLGNDHDSPIYQNSGYFPIAIRTTPNWHRETNMNQPIDAIPGDPTSPLISGKVTQHGFDLGGLDIWLAGTLFKNVSFSVLPSADPNLSFHFENAFFRFDNLKSSWLNVKVGKFELDNMISEKRFLFLSANGGLYQTYHFVPPGDSNDFGLGDNQLGVELSGHSSNSYTRYGVAVLTSNSGNPTLPTARSYDTYLTFSQGLEAGRLGLQRLGAYAYVGQRPTYSVTSSGTPIAGAGLGSKPFYRVGVSGDLNAGKFEFLPFFMHGWDNVYLGTSTAANQPLPDGAQAPVWNGGFIETHYHFNPQFVLVQRDEFIRMSRQALPTNPGNLGNINAYSVGYRWYPFMFSRAGLAFHNEFSLVKTNGTSPLNGVGVAPLSSTAPVWSSSAFIGLDFAF
jgi:hypothetical protein